MTCPKEIIGKEISKEDGVAPSTEKPTIKFTDKEKETIETLLSRL